MLDNEDFGIPIVSAIIERSYKNQVEILIQTRWKPNEDPLYSGTLEIPAGRIKKFENVYDALKREVFEETGLQIKKINPEVKTEVNNKRNDSSLAFLPFCCQQQTRNGMPWIGFVFLCEVEDGDLNPNPQEVKSSQWIPIIELREMITSAPEKFFTLQLAVLRYYLRLK